METAEENAFFRIKEKASGQYFTGGRGTIMFGPKGVRFESMQPVTNSLDYFKEQHARAVELVKKFEESGDPVFADRITYWLSIAVRLSPENFEVVKFREVVVPIEVIEPDAPAEPVATL